MFLTLGLPIDNGRILEIYKDTSDHGYAMLFHKVQRVM